MNNQDVSVERFFPVSSIEYRVSSIEYRVSCIEYRVPTRYTIHDTRCIRVSSIECQLTFSRYCMSSTVYLPMSSFNNSIFVMNLTSNLTNPLIKEESTWKQLRKWLLTMSFFVNYFKNIPIGLSNSPPTFQRVVAVTNLWQTNEITVIWGIKGSFLIYKDWNSYKESDLISKHLLHFPIFLSS